MSFTYQLGANPAIDYVWPLIADTVQYKTDGVTRAYIFDDEAIWEGI